MGQTSGGQLFIHYECQAWEDKSRGLSKEISEIYEWDSDLNHQTLIYTFPPTGTIRSVKFSKDGSFIAYQELVAFGADKLFVLPKGDVPYQLFDGKFYGTKSPAWHPTENKLIFAATYYADYPNSNYSIYTSNPDGQDLQKLISEIQSVGAIKWSPSGKQIGFEGRYKSGDGIWIYDIDTKEVANVMDGMQHKRSFDWSPDGKSMVIVRNKEYITSTYEYRDELVIADLPN